MNDELGTRMKEFYENRTRYFIPRKTYTILRIDGKAFHSYTKNCKKPFDLGLVEDMNQTTKYLCEHIQGAKFAYTQSDEISILMTDFETPQTQMYFDGNIQKISSVVSGMATMEFNRLRQVTLVNDTEDIEKMTPREAIAFVASLPMASFDCRCFTIPLRIEVYNYMIWRNNDASRNSVQMMARSLYSHKECTDKSCLQLQEMISNKGIDWENYDLGLKNGRLIVRESKLVPNEYSTNPSMVERHEWVVKSAPVFTQDPACIQSLIPKQE